MRASLPSGLMSLYKYTLIIMLLIFPYILISDDDKNQTNKKEKPVKINAEIHLCDNRILHGKIELFPPEKIVLIHEVNNLEFSKELKIVDIISITFYGWMPELIETKKEKGKIYKFSVSNYVVETDDELSLKVKKGLPTFLEKFSFSNKYGTVILYTYWIDLLKKDNTWYTGLNGPENGERSLCYKDVVKKIIFKKNKSE